VDINLLSLSQTVWKALHPGQNAMTSMGSTTRFLSAAATLSSLIAVKVIDEFPSQSYDPVSYILGVQLWKNHKIPAEKVTKMCHLPEPGKPPQFYLILYNASGCLRLVKYEEIFLQ
jgi:hypothetical protein